MIIDLALEKGLSESPLTQDTDKKFVEDSLKDELKAWDKNEDGFIDKTEVRILYIITYRLISDHNTLRGKKSDEGDSVSIPRPIWYPSSDFFRAVQTKPKKWPFRSNEGNHSVKKNPKTYRLGTVSTKLCCDYRPLQVFSFLQRWSALKKLIAGYKINKPLPWPAGILEDNIIG